jgi:3-deoxy-manno-octulosonate cytidylyltransferase (CMP-KDO synthetase)
MLNNIALVIPARIESQRLPRKMLMDISGKSVIRRTWERACKAEGFAGVYIATDSQDIIDHMQPLGAKMLRTSNKPQNGTERIGEALRMLPPKITGIINIQGDEPFLNPNVIEKIGKELAKGHDMVTAMCPFKNIAEMKEPSTVKVIFNKKIEAIYFSRAALPFYRDGRTAHPEKWPCQRHIGIYGYQKEFLKKYITLNETPLEAAEKLEQLRVIENGYKITLTQTEDSPKGIDTREDLRTARKLVLEGIHP